MVSSSSAPKFVSQRVNIVDIELNSRATQVRVRLDQDAIREYRQMWMDSDRYPFGDKVKLFHDAETGCYYIADGWHRIISAHLTGRTFLKADVAPGTATDALLYAASANAGRGVRITNGDKRRTVRLVLNNNGVFQLSIREIARRCCVSHTFVQNMVKEINKAKEAASKGPNAGTQEESTTRSTAARAPEDRVTRNQLGLPPVAEVRESTDAQLAKKINTCEKGISTAFKLLPQYVRNRQKLLGIQSDSGADALIAMLDDAFREFNDWKKQSAATVAAE